ncbi:MAG: HEPN domain-containing protein [Spirochaetia bacterium]|nr:HEPN domain-containing protein [Spirochaetia bacterium]
MSKKDELLKEWLKKAESDYQTAELILKEKPELTEPACFHCQQASEKYLKALLIFYDIRFLKSHDLSYLLDLLSEKQEIPENILNAAAELQGYAVEIRYPDDFYSPDLEETKKAYEFMSIIKTFVLEYL